MPQKNKMGQGSPKNDEMVHRSPKQHENKPNDNDGLLELSRRKAYRRPKRGPVSTSQIIAWQERQDGMVGVSTDPQRG